MQSLGRGAVVFVVDNVFFNPARQRAENFQFYYIFI